MNMKNILIFCSGLGIGVLATYLLMRDQYEEILEEPTEEKIDNTESVKTEPVSSDEKKEAKVLILPQRERYKQAVNRLQYDQISASEENMIEETDPAELEHPTDDEEETYLQDERRSNDSNHPNNKTPYIISTEEFSNDMDYYDKITIYYYAEDETLVDENEEIIPDVVDIVGDQALYSFGDRSDDPDVVYVRNEKIETDYEVICLDKSYSETVLGIVPEKNKTQKIRRRGPSENDK